VPEALIDLIDACAETRHRCGGIYNAKTEAARNAVIEALSGVQALSAAPVAFKGGISTAEQSLELDAGFAAQNYCRAKWGAARGHSDWRSYHDAFVAGYLAASPTPPAEQPATKADATTGAALGVEPGAVYAELPAPTASIGTDDAWHEAAMRDFADRTHALRMQATPKAAPGVGNSGFDHKTAADFLNGKTVSDEAVRKFVAASRWAHDERAALSATLLAMHGVLTSREAEIALLKKALLEAEAAPQQEAQEPSHRETVDVVGVRSNGEHVNLEKIAMPPRMKAREIAIEQFGSFKDDDGSDAEMCFGALEYFLEWLIQQGWSKAPQPAPAPLSESEYKRGYQDGYGRRDAEVRGALV
jgi:hypothetical protein